MDFEEIRYEVADRVLTITLDRPDRLNAFTQTMGRELIEAFDQADVDDEVRAVIVTGAGRGVCAGAGLSAGGGTLRRAAGPKQGGGPPRGGGQGGARVFPTPHPGGAAGNGAGG